MASSTVWKEQMIRRRDFNGEKAWRGALASISERIWASVEGVKISGVRRLVIRRVFVGGEGVISGGSVVRSSFSEVVSAGEVEGEVLAEVGGETVELAMRGNV